MRSKSSKNRNYISKSKLNKESGNIATENGNDSEPIPTMQKAAYTMKVINSSVWYEILNIRYYEHLQETFNIEWIDALDKGGTHY